PGKLQEDITVIAGDVDRLDLNKLAAIPVRGSTTTTSTSTSGGGGTGGTGGTSTSGAPPSGASSGAAPGGTGGGASNTSAAPALVTLGQVATIRPGTGPVQIQRLNRNRSIEISGTAVGR